MTDEELLRTPLREMTPAMFKLAEKARDRKLAQISKENKKFKRTPRKHLKTTTVSHLSDGMDAIRNPADGKIYDSKSAYYKSLKERGLVINDGNYASKKTEAFNEKRFDQAFKQTMEKLNV